MHKLLLAVCGLIGAWTLDADTVINLNGGSQNGSFNGHGPITGSYTIHGPGTFTSEGRLYPNNLSHIVTFDQGAVVWLQTHNASTDGLIGLGQQELRSAPRQLHSGQLHARCGSLPCAFCDARAHGYRGGCVDHDGEQRRHEDHDADEEQ